MTKTFRRVTTARKATLCLSTMLCTMAVAHAQTVSPAPVRSSVDAYGVDLFSGALSVDAPSMVLGGNGNSLSYNRWNKGSGWSDNTIAFMNLSGSVMTVAIGPVSDTFTVSGSTYTPTEANGSTLSYNSTTKVFTYTRSDGTVAHFDQTRSNQWAPYGNSGMITDIIEANGENLTFAYNSITYCKSWKPTSGDDICLTTATAYRLGSVTSNYGYQLSPTYDPAFDYVYDPFSPSTQPDFTAWFSVKGMNGLNRASSSTTVLISQGFGPVSGAYVVTDAMSRQTKYRTDASGHIVGITRTGATSEDITFAYASNRVASVTTPKGTSSYSYSDVGSVRTVTVTDPQSHTTTYAFDIPTQRMTSVTNPLGKTTSFAYDASARMTRVTQPEGNYVNYILDSRGNATEERHVSKTSGTPADIVLTAGSTPLALTR